MWTTVKSKESNTSKAYLIGVVSRGKDCGAGENPGIYSRVKMFLDWIRANTLTPQEFAVNKAIIGHRIEQVSGFPALREGEKFVVNPRCEADPKRDQFATTTPPPAKKKDRKKDKNKKKRKKNKKTHKKKKSSKG